MTLVGRLSSALGITLGVVLGVVLGFAVAACACNVPVFRFALERWRADPYRIVVFQRGPLSDADREVLRPLEEQQGRLPANVDVRTVDVDGLDKSGSPEAAADREFLSHLRNPQFPCVAVQYPAHLQIAAPLWLGPLEREALLRVINSPARKELVHRLAAGETAVWILLETGDAAKDDPAAEFLAAELKRLEQTLELPTLTASPDDALATQLPLEIKFSLLRVRRDASEEKMLIAMLLGSEPDLAEMTEPMVFPAFGRGRALLPLVGAGVTAKNIHEAAEFLAGACSCEIKGQNPGFDLLLAADWEMLLSQSGVPLAAISTMPGGVPADESAEAELVPIPKGSSRLHTAVAEPSAANPAVRLEKQKPFARYLAVAFYGLATIGIFAIAIAGLARLRRFM
jgi:hypothetical protein